MNLRGIQYFAEVAQTRSFTEAAVRLSVAQPAVSRQIQKLENELGVELLIRTRRGVELTGAGDYFLKRVLPFLIELNQAKELLSRQSQAEIEDVVIGLTGGEGLAVIPMLLERWAKSFPAAKLKIVPALAPALYEKIREGSVDIGIAPEPLAFDGIWTRPLFEEPLVLIGPLNPNPPVPDIDLFDINDIKALLRLPLIVPSKLNPLRGQIEALGKKYGIEPNISVEIDSMTIIKDLVRRGSGCALTTYAYLANETQHEIVKILPLDVPECWRNVSLFGSLSKDGAAPSSVSIDFIQGLVIDTVKADLWPGARILPKYASDMSDG